MNAAACAFRPRIKDTDASSAPSDGTLGQLGDLVQDAVEVGVAEIDQSELRERTHRVEGLLCFHEGPLERETDPHRS
nr:hypothetical protein GCM10020092_022010 [Actinoplanes digitatis]